VGILGSVHRGNVWVSTKRVGGRSKLGEVGYSLVLLCIIDGNTSKSSDSVRVGSDYLTCALNECEKSVAAGVSWHVPVDLWSDKTATRPLIGTTGRYSEQRRLRYHGCQVS